MLAARSLHRYDSEYWLSQYGGLASDAAAMALRSGSPERAVELLEHGRTILIAQALDNRTDLTTLRARDTALADRFEWLSVQMEADVDEHPDSSRRRVAADELDAVVAAIRALPGMDRFLLPATAAELLDQAEHGPIVMVNISTYRCDALALTQDGIRVRPLPEITPDAVSDHVHQFLTALEIDCQSDFRSIRERGERILTATLTWLWHGICAPVLDTVNPAPDERM